MPRRSSGTAQFVEFGEQVAGLAAARVLPARHDSDRATSTFFSDWYAGRKFGELAVKTGEARGSSRRMSRVACEADALRNQRPIQLAYLYDATGETKKAEELWAIEPASR